MATNLPRYQTLSNSSGNRLTILYLERETTTQCKNNLTLKNKAILTNHTMTLPINRNESVYTECYN